MRISRNKVTIRELEFWLVSFTILLDIKFKNRRAVLRDYNINLQTILLVLVGYTGNYAKKQSNLVNLAIAKCRILWRKE